MFDCLRPRVYSRSRSGWSVGHLPTVRLSFPDNNLNTLYLGLRNVTTTVHIDDETRSLLTELQTEIERETGTAVTEREILARLVRAAADGQTELVNSARETPRSVSEETVDAFNSGMFASDVETSEADIDEILYS